MSTITLPNIRVSSDLTVKVRLKDGGVAIDWSTLSGIRALIYADAQRAMAGRCAVSIDAEDATLLVCQYAANKPQYLGVNRIVVSATYQGETKTYDKPALKFVRWTDDQAGQEITISDPDVDVEIEVEDISSSILQEAVDAAFSAAERAEEAAAAAEHMVDIHQGPPGEDGKSPYIGENGHWYEWDEDAGEYVDTETEAQGETGTTPDITIGTVTTAEPGTPAAATMTGTPEAPVLNLTIPKGVAGDTPAFTVGEVTTGQPGTPVVVTITGTAAAPVLNVTIPQGLQGNTGSSVEYPYELVNNLTTNDATKGLSAAQGKVLKDELTQLEAKKADKDTVRAYMMTIRAKQALLAVFDKVAFAFPDVSAEMAELENSLFNLDEIVGIEATYTQGDTVVYDQGVNTLDELKDNLIVKAVYGDGTKVPVQSYTLSGDITVAGTDTVSVHFLGFIDTFDVVVTHYTAQMVFKISLGDLASYKGYISRYDNNTKFAVNDFGTSTNRRVFLAGSGDTPLTNSSGTSISKYPIPIPRNSRKVTITIAPSATQNISYAITKLDGGTYRADVAGWDLSPYSLGGASKTWSAANFDRYRKGGWYIFFGGSPVSSYSGNEPTEVVVTFE